MPTKAFSYQPLEILPVTHIRVIVRVEDAAVFPFLGLFPGCYRDGFATFDVEVETGRIKDWPVDQPTRVDFLSNPDVRYLAVWSGMVVGHLERYVPMESAPGLYRPDVRFLVGADGCIVGWDNLESTGMNRHQFLTTPDELRACRRVYLVEGDAY